MIDKIMAYEINVAAKRSHVFLLSEHFSMN